MSHILLFGASGRTGKLVLDYALEQGHQVTALVRNASKITARDRLAIVVGTPLNVEDVQKASSGTDAVIVALNNVRTSDLPWAKQVSPPRFMADSVANAVTAMATNGARRIVIISANGVGDSRDYAIAPIRFLVKRTNLGTTYADHDLVDAEIRNTDTDWTLIRPVTLTNNDTARKIHATDVGGPRPGKLVSRTDVARFAVDALDDASLFGRAPIVWSTK